MKTPLSKVAIVAALASALPTAALAQSTLSPGEPVQGALSRESETIARNVHYFDDYTISGTAGVRIIVAMQSDEFDTMIEIGEMWDGRFRELSVDDDGGDGLNSRLVFTFPETRDYVVRARSFGDDDIGPYTIELTELGPPPPPPPPIRIRPGRTASGELTLDSATYQADGYGSGERRYVDYELRGREGDTRTITLHSDDFDSFLEIGAMSPLGFAVVDSNDDGVASGEEESLGLNSRLRISFQQSGTLTIRATSLDGGVTGAYTLTVE